MSDENLAEKASAKTKPVSAVSLYRQITPLRREGVCSALIIAHVIAIFVVGYVPILFPIGILTSIGVLTVCVMALTGPIYRSQLDYKRGELYRWGIGNKIAALVILVIFIGSYSFLVYWLFFRK
jgi:hypothetical protein